MSRRTKRRLAMALGGGAAALAIVFGWLVISARLRWHNAEALMHRAQRLNELGKHDAALKDYRRVIELAPPDSALRRQARLHIGYSLLWLRRPREAAPEFDSLRQDSPQSAEGKEAAYYFGYCQTQMDPDRAIAELGNVVRSDYDDIHKVRAEMMIAGAHLAQGRPRQALAACERVLANDSPEFAAWHDDALVFKAEVHVRERRYSEALALIERVLAEYPDSPAAKRARELRDKVRSSVR